MLEHDVVNILDIQCGHGYLSSLLIKKYPDSKIFTVDEENIKFEEGAFDLITYSLGLHWINDIQEFLLNIRKLLKNNGIFIGNFIGGASLQSLRKALIEAEIKSNFSHSPHISPFIHFDHVAPLFTGVGFKEIITDYEKIDIEFNSPVHLMKEIKNIGESNAFDTRTNYAISKKMLEILSDDTKSFHDQITIISFIASPDKKTIKIA